MARRNRFKRVTRKRRTRRRATKRRYPGRAKNSFSKRVKRVLYKLSETKSTFFESGDTLRGNPAMADWQDYNIMQLTPTDIAGLSWNVGVQGTQQGQRVGNQIRVTGHKVRMCIYPESNGLNKPFYLKLVIMSIKTRTLDTVSQLKTIMQQNCFQRGSGAIGLQSELSDLNEEWNRDLLTIHFQKEFKMGSAAPFQAGTANNDFKYGRRFTINVKKYYKNLIKYNDASQIPMISKNVYMVWLVAAADGTYATGDTYWARVEHNHYISYKDI